MGWLEVSITSSLKYSEIISGLLCDIVDKGFAEIPEKEKITYKIYFPVDKSLEVNLEKTKKALRDLSLTGTDTGEIQVSLKKLENENWAENWKNFYKPLKVGEGIVVKPPWEDYKGKEKIIINIYPAMAFGTGSHETTRICMSLMEKYVPGKSSLLDFGSGTGILSIASLFLGVEKVYAIDYDTLCMKALEENLSLNKLSGRVTFFLDDSLRNFTRKVDVIVANILATVFKEHRKEFHSVLLRGGILILSGILNEQKEDIIKIFTEEGFDYLEEKVDGEWAGLVFNRKG